MPIQTTQDRGTPMQVLLVEDSRADALIMQKGFSTSKNHSYHVTLATDGQMALSMLKKEGEHANVLMPHIILLDLSLPKINGKEVLEAIKTDQALKHIPVIVMTGSDGRVDVIKSYHLHANAYVSKPRDAEQLQQVVEGISAFWVNCVVLPDEDSVKSYNAL